MTELLCDIKSITTKDKNDYFLVYSQSEDKEYTIPTYQLLKHKVDVGQKHFFKKEINLESKKYFLNYIRPQINNDAIFNHHYYKCGGVYDFKILSFSIQENKKGIPISLITLEDIDKKVLTILGLKWQRKDIWKFDTLKCEVERILNKGELRLINKNFRHPLYEIGKEYEFEILEKKIKQTINGNMNIFLLKGIDECVHEVSMLPGQNMMQYNIEKVKCKILNITTHLKLTQTNIRDPFYTAFENIEKDKYLENKYFTILFNNSVNPDRNINQLIEQYNSKSAFWVFTYTNKVLVNRLKESIERHDYKEAKEINQLIITFEEWIITKGIISSFPDEENKSSTKHKAKRSLESAKIYDTIFSILNYSQLNILSNNSFFSDKHNLLARFYYLFSFSNIELLEFELLTPRLLDIISIVNINSESDIYYLEKILKHISYSKRVFITEKEKENFSLYSASIAAVNFTDKESKYITLSYGEILIASKLSMREHVNILCGQMLKLFTKSFSDIKTKESLLFNAYKYFDYYQNSELVIPFEFKEQLEINFDILENENARIHKPNQQWNELEKLYNNTGSFSVRLTKKSKTGYEVNYNDLIGFLPYHNLKDRKLKKYPFVECDFTINAKCLSISRPFNFFIIEQVSNSDFSDSYKNNLLFNIGNIYDAIIVNVVDYGLFLSTSAGEGLLHINHIFDFNWNANNINKYFKIGQTIKVVLSELSSENKANFNFYQIKSKEPLYYNEFIEQVFENNTNIVFESEKEIKLDSYFERALNEKAFCIEQFAVLQLDISKKLQNFLIAKQFYTNAKNARSFLLNIYISYFEILLKIKETIQSASLNNIYDIKANAQEIKNKINQKTIDTFPDSDKLIFFLDIVSMFNEKSDATLELIFEYIKTYNNESAHNDLRTIAKITMANNLLVSESKEDSDFVLKNLRLIFDYLSNGILSLEESIDDKNARELKEEILYWQQKINEDESETLEFKSSLFTPILDESSKKQLEILSNNDNKTANVNIAISRINGDLAKKRVMHSALKTLVAFANSSGGTLLIGIDNDKNIIGLENEYNSSSQKLQYPNRDGFGLFFDEIIRTFIGDSFSSLMNRRFLKFPEGDLLIVKVEPSPNEVFLLKNEEGKEGEQLWIRNLSSSKELTGSELAKYIKNRHLSQLTKGTS